MNEAAPEWYALAQATICLSSAWAILALYWRGTPVRQGEPAQRPTREPGLFWLGLAVALWGIVGLVLLLPLDSRTAQALRPLLSSANSACLLISASHLDYGAAILQRASSFPRWNHAAILGALVVALITLLLYAVLGSAEPVARLPDFSLSLVTLLLYGFGLFRSFLKRGFGPLAVLAIVAIASSFIAQIPEITDILAPLGLTGDRRWVLNLASKSILLVAFLALAMSWVHEVARRPSSSAVHLFFTGRRVGPQGRRRWLVRLGEASIEMRETPHRDLLVLAVRRVVEKAKPEGGWVPLPDLVGKLDDSRIRRMREDLRPAGLDGAVESNFQKAYRLAVDPEKIGFDRAAFGEEAELGAIIKALP